MLLVSGKGTMDYMKDGKKRTEFWPQQDLAGDKKGQEQASRLARSARLRIALGKMTDDKNLIQGLMRIWAGEKAENVTATDISGFFWNFPQPGANLQVAKPVVFPTTVTDEERKLVGELRRLAVGV